MCNLQTRNHFQTNSRDLVNSIFNQRHVSKGISRVSLILIPCQEAERMEVLDYFHEKLSE